MIIDRDSAAVYRARFDVFSIKVVPDENYRAQDGLRGMIPCADGDNDSDNPPHIEGISSEPDDDISSDHTSMPTPHDTDNSTSMTSPEESHLDEGSPGNHSYESPLDTSMSRESHPDEGYLDKNMSLEKLPDEKRDHHRETRLEGYLHSSSDNESSTDESTTRSQASPSPDLSSRRSLSPPSTQVINIPNPWRDQINISYTTGTHGAYLSRRDANREALKTFLSLANPGNARLEDNLTYQRDVRPYFIDRFRETEKQEAIKDKQGTVPQTEGWLASLEFEPPSGGECRFPYLMLSVWVARTELKGPVDLGDMSVTWDTPSQTKDHDALESHLDDKE
jgi:hypothetical protein